MGRPMEVTIAICDDNENDVKMIRREIDNVAETLPENEFVYQFEIFNSGNELNRRIEEVAQMHVLFLDIDMPGINGMEIAQKLANMESYVNVIFVTNRADLVFEAIHHRPFRFIRKPYIHKEMQEAFPAVLEAVQEQSLFFEIPIETNHVVQIRVSEVMYLESHGHYVTVHRRNNEEEVVRARISDFAKKLEKYGFLRTHVGYLVNVRDVYSITSQQIKLDNREVIPLSRKYAEHVRTAHADYIRRSVCGIS